jgi:c-di-GMP-related signal transduction protein
MPPSSSLLTAGPATFVARQPILDRASRLRGYELLYRRSAAANTSEGASRDVATAGVIEAMYGAGFETLTGGHKAFLNISRQLLLEGIPSVLPMSRVVLELGTDIEADADVLAACRRLKADGYSLAIDDFTLTDQRAELVPLADFLKVDFQELSRSSLCPPTFAPGGGPAIVAKRVDTAGGFQQAVLGGHDLFQGFFLGKPVLKAARAVSAQHLAGVKLLHAMSDPDLTIFQLEELVKHDAAMCFLILRTINSATYALRTTVRSIHDALVLLGRDTVRRWASLWALAGLGRHTHSELLTMATVRARCCELLAASTGHEDVAAEGFMVGLCSLLDAILEQPMPALVEALPFSDTVRDALLGADNRARRTLDCVVAYEEGDWARCVALAAVAGGDPAVLPGAYVEAVSWSSELKQGAAR